MLPQPLNGFINIISFSSLGMPKMENMGLKIFDSIMLSPLSLNNSRAMNMATIYGRLVRIRSNDVFVPATNELYAFTFLKHAYINVKIINIGIMYELMIFCP